MDGVTTVCDGTLVLAGSDSRPVPDTDQEVRAGIMLSVGTGVTDSPVSLTVSMLSVGTGVTDSPVSLTMSSLSVRTGVTDNLVSLTVNMLSVRTGVSDNPVSLTMNMLSVRTGVTDNSVSLTVNMLSVGTMSGVAVNSDTLTLAAMLSVGTMSGVAVNSDRLTLAAMLGPAAELAIEENNPGTVSVTTSLENTEAAAVVAMDAATDEVRAGEDRWNCSLTCAVSLKLADAGWDAAPVEGTWDRDDTGLVGWTTDDPFSDVIPTAREEE